MMNFCNSEIISLLTSKLVAEISVKNIFFSLTPKTPKLFFVVRDISSNSLTGLPYISVYSSVLLRKKVIEDVGYYDEQWDVCQDYDFWLRM